MNRRKLMNREYNGEMSPYDNEGNDHICGSKNLKGKNLGGGKSNISDIEKHKNAGCELRGAGVGWAGDREGMTINDDGAKDTSCGDEHKNIEEKREADQGGQKNLRSGESLSAGIKLNKEDVVKKVWHSC
jgi:hypothetical protein